MPLTSPEKRNAGVRIFPPSEWQKIQLTNVKLEDFEFEEMGWLVDFEQVKK